MLSIPLNLAEGSAKPTSPDRRKFYFIALGSLREVQTLLALFGRSSGTDTDTAH
ncbi:MAG: four helix bundle protein [Deltaproteobacteria bacterium]|nr:four helix bundle protein [Deltaproteobacteria bacterium]